MANSGNKKARKVKNLGAIYYDNVKNKWVGQIQIGEYDNGRAKYKKFYGDSQNAVIEKMRQHKENNPTFINTTATSGVTLGEFLKNYLVTVKKTKLKPSSYTRDMQIYKNQIDPILGQYDISEITHQMIQVDLINKMIEQEYSHSTIHKTYVLLNEILRYAGRQGIITTNPCELVEEPSKKIFTNTKEIRFFNDVEIQRFKDAALFKDDNSNIYHYRNGLALLSIIYTGLRIGELVALKWCDVDIENGYLKIHSNISVSYTDDDKRQIKVQDSTKTRKSRIVHLTKSAKKYYKIMKKIYKPDNDDYVYFMEGKRDTTRALNTYTFICKRANIDNHQGVHTLRHTCASLLIRKGVDIKIISEMLGHKDVAFTYNTYVHLIEEEKAKTIGQLDI